MRRCAAASGMDPELPGARHHFRDRARGAEQRDPRSRRAVFGREVARSPPDVIARSEATKQSMVAWLYGLLRFARNDDCHRQTAGPPDPSSFRGDTEHRTMMCDCTSQNLEI